MKKAIYLIIFTISSYYSTAQKPFINLIRARQIAFPPFGNQIESLNSEVICLTNYPIPVSCGNLIRNNNFIPIVPFNQDEPFNLSQVPEWGASSGTPNLYDLAGSINGNPLNAPSPPASGFASFSYDSQQGGNFVEGIAQKIPELQTGQKYVFSFFKALTKFPNIPSTVKLKVELLNCSLFSTFPQNYDEPIFPPGANHQTIYCEINPSNSNWEQNLVTFVANGNYDIIMITPNLTTFYTTPGTNLFGTVNFAFPELKNISNFTAGVATPSGNCLASIGPAIPNCGVYGSVFTWLGPNGQSVIAPANQQIQINTSIPANAGTWTLQMTVPGAASNTNSCIASSLPVQASLFVQLSSCSSIPSISPVGPIDYHYFWEGGSVGVKLTSSLPNNNQWYRNGILVPNATSQIYRAFNGGNYKVLNTTFSNVVTITDFPYGQGSITLGQNFMPVPTSSYYCTNSISPISQLSLGSLATYTWNTNPFPQYPSTPLSIDPSSYNVNSPNANLVVGSALSYGDPSIQGIADLNGVQKVIDYSLTVTPRLGGNGASYCNNVPYSFFALDDISQPVLPGLSKFQYETYDFGINGTIVSPLQYAGLHQISIAGNNTQPSAIPFKFKITGNTTFNRYFYNSVSGCYKTTRNLTLGVGCKSIFEPEISLNIYPNPAINSNITIESNEDILQIEVLNFYSNPIIKLKVNRLKLINIPIIELDNGIYTIQITTLLGIENKKLIIKH